MLIDYSALDHPLLLNFIFYPRRDHTPCPSNAFDLTVKVEEEVQISCRFYMEHPRGPSILFFHGNGEVVSDYDEMAPFYHRRGINLVVSDYRGYGKSSGFPTLTSLYHDAPLIFQGVKDELIQRGFRSDLWVMGRSLGSLSALEIGRHLQKELKGLIIESGFHCVTRILTHFGYPLNLNISRIDQESLKRIGEIFLPTLIIHGDRDQIVPIENGQTIFQSIQSEDKEFLIIPKANHNDIFWVGREKYLEAVQKFIERTDQPLTTRHTP